MPVTDTQALALYRRIREVLDEGYGSIREVDADRVELGNRLDTDDDAAMQAAVRPRIRVEPGPCAPGASRPANVNTDVDMETTEWAVIAEYSLPPDELGESYPTREDIYARARSDASRFKAALEEPANLTADSFGNATGVIAGTVTWRGSTPRVRGELLSYEHRYSAEVHVTEEI